MEKPLSYLERYTVQDPAGIEPITDFDVHQYVGKWYEVARLDNRFQRDLVQVTATYTLQGEGSIRVENEGKRSQTGRTAKVIGQARFVGASHIGHLKVSFQWPF